MTQTEDRPIQATLVPDVRPSRLFEDDAFPIGALPESYAAPEPGMIASVQKNGVLAPLILIPHPDPHAKYKYKVCDGLRRLAAAQKAGVQTVPVWVYDMDPTYADVTTVMLNQKRSENAVAELQAIERVMGKAIGEREISRATGIPEKKIRELLSYRLLNDGSEEGKFLRECFDSYKLPPPLAKFIVSKKELLDRIPEVAALVADRPRLLKKDLDGLLEAKGKKDQPALIGEEVTRPSVATGRPEPIEIDLDALHRAVAAGMETVPVESLRVAFENGHELESIHTITRAVVDQVKAFLHFKGVKCVVKVQVTQAPKEEPEASATTAQEPAADATPTPPGSSDGEEPYEPVDMPYEPAPETTDDVVDHFGTVDDDNAPTYSHGEPPAALLAETFGEPLVSPGAAATLGSEEYRADSLLAGLVDVMGAGPGKDLCERLTAKGLGTLEALAQTSVWRLAIEVEGVGAATAKRLYDAGLLHPFYVEGKVPYSGFVEGQYLRVLDEGGDPADQATHEVDKIAKGATGGLHVRAIDGSGGSVFYRFAQIRERFLPV